MNIFKFSIPFPKKFNENMKIKKNKITIIFNSIYE